MTARYSRFIVGTVKNAADAGSLAYGQMGC